MKRALNPESGVESSLRFSLFSFDEGEPSKLRRGDQQIGLTLTDDAAGEIAWFVWSLFSWPSLHFDKASTTKT